MTQSHQPFAGRAYLITGAGNGIGKQTALHLASLGAVVGINDLREAFVEGTVGAVREQGGQAIAAIYAWQQRYLTYSDKSLDWMVMKFMDEAAGCAGVLSDLSEAGRSLLANYDAYLSPAVAAGAPSSTHP